MISLKKQQAEALGYKEHPYDALLDEFEPEARTSEIANVLNGLREQLVPMATSIQLSSRIRERIFSSVIFPSKHKKPLSRKPPSPSVMILIAAVWMCPCIHLPPVLARTTAASPRDTTGSGSTCLSLPLCTRPATACTQQGLPAEHYGLPLGEVISLGIHESQSRMWENLVGRSRAFWSYFFPKAQAQFPLALGHVSLDEFYFAINEVRPSLIRVEADEVTYNLHILIRFELELAMIEGDLQAADLPGAWKEKYQKYLGITPPNDAEGVLQDIHWSAGFIGYFPTYALGNLYASQFFAQARSDLGDLDAMFQSGEFQPLRQWLREKIHSQGHRYSASELVQRVTGRPLSYEPLMAHLSEKFYTLYGLNL